MEVISNFASSNVAKIGYDANQSVLNVWFHDGSCYQYFDVQISVWEDFKVAGSKGEYMHSSIRGKYRYAKV